MTKGHVERFWEHSNKDIFQTKDYKVDFRSDFMQEYDDLAYAIKRGKMDKVKEMIRMNRQFDHKARFKNTGESILHVCAEYD